MNISRINNAPSFGTRLSHDTKVQIISRSKHAMDVIEIEDAVQKSPLFSKLDDTFEISIQPGWFDDVNKNRYGDITLTKEVDGETLTIPLRYTKDNPQTVAKLPKEIQDTVNERGMLKEGVCKLINSITTNYNDTDSLRIGFLVEAGRKFNIRRAIDLYLKVHEALVKAESQSQNK